MVTVMLVLRWSPLGLPYYLFGGKQELMELEANLSSLYYGALVFEWAVITSNALILFCVGAICVEEFLRISLISWALRQAQYS